MPVPAAQVWQSGAKDASAVVIDIAGPVPFAVDGARLAALAQGRPAPLPHEDPDVMALAHEALAAEPVIAGYRLQPATDGTDLTLLLVPVPGHGPEEVRDAAQRAGQRLMGGAGDRVRRGIQIAVAELAAGNRRPERGREGSAAGGGADAAVDHARPLRGRIGIMLRWLTAGESHGRALVAICEGLPAGVEVSTADVAAALARRRAGYGRGARMKFEQDEAEITGGVRHGVTLGSPVAIRIGNTEWPKWDTVMAPDPVPAGVLDDLARAAPLTRPRPGHADLAGMQKYGHQDARPVLERASARETAARVALGELARRYLRQAVRRRDREPRGGDRPGLRTGRRHAPAGGRGAGRRGPGALPGPGRERGDAGGDRRRAQGRRHARRGRRGGGLRPARRALAVTCTGTAGWTGAWPPR